MKRGLKGSRVPLQNHRSRIVEEPSPMKRGLKGEESELDIFMRARVEEPSPMKRGLKDVRSKVVADRLPSVEEPSPMKRGLKDSCDGRQSRNGNRLRAFPDEEGAESAKTKSARHESRRLKSLP